MPRVAYIHYCHQDSECEGILLHWQPQKMDVFTTLCLLGQHLHLGIIYLFTIFSLYNFLIPSDCRICCFIQQWKRNRRPKYIVFNSYQYNTSESTLFKSLEENSYADKGFWHEIWLSITPTDHLVSKVKISRLFFSLKTLQLTAS